MVEEEGNQSRAFSQLLGLQYASRDDLAFFKWCFLGEKFMGKVWKGHFKWEL